MKKIMDIEISSGPTHHVLTLTLDKDGAIHRKKYEITDLMLEKLKRIIL